MATRRETQQRRESLRRTLLVGCRGGEMRPGEIMPPIRDLAQQHQLSVPVARQVVRSLIAEGLLNARPGAGTVVRHQSSMMPQLFLLLLEQRPGSDLHTKAMQNGFEERLSQLGGSSIALDYTTAHQHLAKSGLPPVSGVFAFLESSDYSQKSAEHVGAGTTRVEFGPSHSGAIADRVYFDNAGGGRQAAEHLLFMGHENVAFLGLHGLRSEPGIFLWSKERENGWRSALLKERRVPDGLAFRPRNTSGSNPREQIEAAREAATALVNLRYVTAVVAANGLAAQGLFEALCDAKIDRERWPAVVCFDESREFGWASSQQWQAFVDFMTTVSLPWHQVGREAADLLWQRHRRLLPESSQQRLVPMRLITRLTCRRAWSDSDSVASLVTVAR